MPNSSDIKAPAPIVVPHLWRLAALLGTGRSIPLPLRWADIWRNSIKHRLGDSLTLLSDSAPEHHGCHPLVNIHRNRVLTAIGTAIGVDSLTNGHEQGTTSQHGLTVTAKMVNMGMTMAKMISHAIAASNGLSPSCRRIR